MPAGDPSGGVYTYEQARAVGIDVPPIPSAAEMCPPPDPTYSGIRPEDIDTPEERAALERGMEKACPRRVVRILERLFTSLATTSPPFGPRAARSRKADSSALAIGSAPTRTPTPCRQRRRRSGTSRCK